MNKKNLLVTLANKDYIDQAKQLFSSVYFNAGWDGDYMLLAHEIPESELKWFKDRDILVYDCKPIPFNKLNGKWPPVVLSKFYIFKPEFKKWNNVVFLDGDIIVRSPLDALTNSAGLSAVTGHKHFKNLFLNRLYMFLDKISDTPFFEIKKMFDFKEKSFNTGVLAFNTCIIKDGTFDKLLELSNKYFKISASGEEAILNIYFYKKWNSLPELYNLYPDCLIPDTGISAKDLKGIILHFIINKPWGLKNFFYKEWKENFDKADRIDLNNRPIKKNTWTDNSVSDEVNKIKKLRKKRFLFHIIRVLITKIDMIVGLFGMTLKKYCPLCYKILIKFKYFFL